MYNGQRALNNPKANICHDISDIYDALYGMCVGESEKRINYTHIARTFHGVFILCTRLIEANEEMA